MRKFRRTLIIAVLFYFLDVFVLDQGFIAAAILFIVFFIAFPRILVAILRRNTSLSKERFIRTGIYLVAAILIFLSRQANQDIAFLRAEKVIHACMDYNAKYRRFPERLEELVPEFMARLPKANYTLYYNYFDYVYVPAKSQHWLIVFICPPFLRRAYKFEEGTWSDLD